MWFSPVKEAPQNFIQEGTYKYIPYWNLFRRTEFLEVEGYGRFEAYSNRDSLKYLDIYGLENILTLYRGTIRRVGFLESLECICATRND